MAFVCPAKAASKRLKKLRSTWNHRLQQQNNNSDEQQQQQEQHDDVTSFKRIEKIKESNLSTVKLLGSGGYSNVYLARDKKDGRSFAIKRLKPSVCVNRKILPICTGDFAVETAILANLHHENIIALRGIKKGDAATMFKNGSFFIAIDPLNETLKDRLELWRKEGGRWKFGNNKINDNSLKFRLENAALGIVKAMEYIHSKQLIYRDLKPENIGFAMDGTVKIFDFGLARVGAFSEAKEDTFESSRNNDNNSNCRNMTARVGTPKYMAPEVARGNTDYDYAVDVYSFSLILWQIVTNRIIFGKKKSTAELSVLIATKIMRPSLKCVVGPDMLKELMQQSWSNDPKERPTFTAIRERLEYMIENPNILNCGKNNKKIVGGRSSSIMNSLQARKQKKDGSGGGLIFLRTKSNNQEEEEEGTQNEFDDCSIYNKELKKHASICTYSTYNTSASYPERC